MPLLIEHIDAIARRKKSDVLFVAFEHPDEAGLEGRLVSIREWQTLPVRREVINWLDRHGIAWQPCGSFAGDRVLGTGYHGHIYNDMPLDETLPDYQALVAFLERPDGTTRLPGVRFFYTTYEEAMKNAHHDAPDYWDHAFGDEDGVQQ